MSIWDEDTFDVVVESGTTIWEDLLAERYKKKKSRRKKSDKIKKKGWGNYKTKRWDVLAGFHRIGQYNLFAIAEEDEAEKESDNDNGIEVNNEKKKIKKIKDKEGKEVKGTDGDDDEEEAKGGEGEGEKNMLQNGKSRFQELRIDGDVDFESENVEHKNNSTSVDYFMHRFQKTLLSPSSFFTRQIF